MSRIEYKVKKCIKIKGEKYVRLYSSLDNIEFLITHNIINCTKHNIIFVHGLAGTSDIWHHLMHQCYKYYNVYALDLPWNGRNSIEYRNYHFFFEWFANIINSLNLDSEKTYIVAHSFGATMTLSSYIVNNINISKLILCAPTWKNEDGSHIDWVEYKEFITNFELSLYEYIKLTNKNIKDDIIDIMLDKVLQESSPRHTLSFIDCLFNLPDIPESEKMQIQTLVLYGEKDEVVSTLHSKYLCKVLPNSSLISFPESGHYLMLDDVSNFNDKIIKYLEYE